MFRAAAMLSIVVSAARPADRLTIGFSHVPPLHYADAQGRPAGFVVDVITEAARRERIEIKWNQVGGSNDIERALDDGRIDLFPAGVFTEARRARYWISEPWWSEDLSILTLPGIGSGAGAWRGLRVVLGTPTYSAIAPQAVPGAAFVLLSQYETHGGAALSASMICEGQVDAALLAHTEVDEILASRPPPCRNTDFVLIETKSFVPLAVISTRHSAPWAVRLRTRFDELARDGTLAAFADRYPRIPASECRRTG